MTSFFKWTAILFFIFVIFLKQCFANILQKNFRGDHLEEKFAIVTSSTNNKPIYKREVSFRDKNAKHKAPDVINKKNLVLFRDSNNKVIATLRDPRTWNSANVTLSKIDDYKRLQQELRSLAIFKNTISFPMEKKKEKDYINVPNKKHHIIHIAKHLAAKKVQNNKQIEKKLHFYDKDKKVNTTSKHLRSRNNSKVSLSKHDDYKRHQQEIDRVSIKGEQRQEIFKPQQMILIDDPSNSSLENANLDVVLDNTKITDLEGMAPNIKVEEKEDENVNKGFGDQRNYTLEYSLQEDAPREIDGSLSTAVVSYGDSIGDPLGDQYEDQSTFEPKKEVLISAPLKTALRAPIEKYINKNDMFNNKFSIEKGKTNITELPDEANSNLNVPFKKFKNSNTYKNYSINNGKIAENILMRTKNTHLTKENINITADNFRLKNKDNFDGLDSFLKMKMNISEINDKDLSEKNQFLLIDNKGDQWYKTANEDRKINENIKIKEKRIKGERRTNGEIGKKKTESEKIAESIFDNHEMDQSYLIKNIAVSSENRLVGFKNYSVAAENSSTAFENRSIEFKNSSTVFEFNTTPFKSNSTAFESSSIAFESNSTAFESNSTAFESNSTAFERNSTAFERNSTAFESNSTAFESNSTAFESNSTAFESNSTAFEDNSFTFKNNLTPLKSSNESPPEVISMGPLKKQNKTSSRFVFDSLNNENKSFNSNQHYDLEQIKQTLIDRNNENKKNNSMLIGGNYENLKSYSGYNNQSSKKAKLKYVLKRINVSEVENIYSRSTVLQNGEFRNSYQRTNKDFLMQENHPIKTKGFYVSTLKNSLKDKIERSFIFDKNYESDKKNHFYKKTNNFENYDDGLYDSDQLSYNDLHNEIQNSKTRISNDADPDNEVQSSKNIDEVEELDRDKIERLADEKNDFFPKRDFNVSMEPMEFIESDDLLESESYKKKVERVKRMRHVFHPTVDLEDTKQTLFFLNTTLQTSHSGSSPQSLDSQNGFLDSPIPAKSSTNHPTTSPYSFTKAIVPFVYNTTPKPFVTSLKTFSDYNSENLLRSINDNDNSDIKEKFKNVVVSDTLFNKTENEYNNGLDASRVNKEMESPGKPGSMLSPHILMDIGIYPTLLNENKEPLTSNRIPENLPPSSKSYENPPKLQLAQNYESLKDSDFNAAPDADDLLDEKYASEEAKNFNQKNLKQNITNNNNFSFEEKEHSLDHEKGLFALDSHNDSPLESYKSIKYSEQPEYFKQSKKSANESLEDALVTDKKQEEKKQKDISTENLIPTKVDDHFYPPLKGIDQSDYIVDKFSLNPNFVDKDGKLKISAEQMKSSGVKSNKSSELKENTSKKPSNGLTKGNESEPLTNSIENTLPTKSYENGSPTKISIKFHVLDGSTGKSKPIKELVIPIGSFTSKISQEIPDKDEVLIQLTKVLLKLFAKSNNKLLENKDISTASKEKLHQKENQTDILQTLNLLKSLSEKPDVEEVYKQSENKENEIQSTDLNKYLKSHDINNDLKNAIQSVLKEISDERSQSLLLSKIDKSRNNPVNRYASYKGPDMESTDDDTRNNALDLAIKIINSEIKKNFDWKKQKNIPQILRDESINDESPFVRKNAFNNNQTSSNDNVFNGNENNNKNDYLNRNKNKNDYLNRNENKNDYLNRNNTFDIYNNSNKNAEDFLRSGKNTFLTNDDVKNETSKMLTNIKEMGKQDNVPTNVIVDPLSTSFNSAKNADPRGKTSEVKNERNLTVQKFNEFLPSYKNEILRSSEQKYIQPKYNKKVNTYSYLEKNNNDFKSIKKSILKVTGVIQPSEYEFHDGSHLENASKFTKDSGETLNTMPLLNQKNLFFSDCSCDSCPCKLGKKVINENSIRRQATTMSSYDDEKMMSSRSSFENVQPTSSPYFMTTKSLLDFSKQTLDEPCFGDFCEQKSCVSPPCYNQEEQCLSPPCSFPGTDWKVSHMSYGSACLCLDGKGNCSCHTDKETPKFSSYSSRPPVTLSPLCNSPPCIQQANSYSNCANYPCQFQSYFNIPLSCTNAPCQNNQNAITQNTGLQNAITQNAGMQNAIVQSPGNFRCSSSPCQQNDFSSQCYGTQCSSPPNFSTNCFSPQNFYSPCSLPQKYNNYNKDFTNHPQNCGNGIPCISSSANYFNNYENSYGNLPNFYQSPCTNTVCCNNSPCLNDQFKDKKNKNKNKESENDDNSINLKIENTYSQEDTTTKSPTRRPTRKVLIVFAPTQPPKIIYAPPPAPPPPIYSVQAPKTIYKTVSIATTPITNQIQVQPIATNYQPSTSSPRLVNVVAEPMVTKPVYVIRYINRVPQPSKPKIVVNNRKVPQRIVTAPMAAEKIVKKPLQSYQFKRPSFYRGSNRLSNYQNNINTEYNRRPVSINRYSNRNTGKLTTRPTSVNRYSNRVPSELNTRPTSINRYSNRPPSETSTPYEYNPLSKYSRKLNALRQKNRFRNNLRPTNSTVDQDSLNYEENPNYFNPTKYQKSINKFPVKYPFKNKLQGSNNDPSNDPENSLLSSSFVHTKQRNLENEAEEEEGTVFDSEDVFESNSVDGNSSKDKSSSQSVLELAKNKKFRNQLKSMKGNDNIEKLVKGITNHARNSGAIPMSDIEERISDLLAEAIVSAKQTSGSKKYNENGFKKKVNPLSEFFENGLVRHNIASRLSNYFSYASKGHSNSEHKELLQNQKSNVNKITIKKNDLNSKIDSLNAYSTLFKNLTSGNIEKAIGAKRSKTITKNEISKQNLFGFPSSNNKLAKINSSSKVLVAKSLQNGNNGFTKNPKLNFKVPNLRLKSQNPVVTSKQLPTAFISQKTKLKPIVKNAFKINQRFNQNPQLSFSLKIDKNSNQQIKNTSKMEIKKTYQKAKDRYPENNFRIKSSQYTINNFNTQTVNRLKFKPTKKDLRALHPISTQVLKFILPLKNNNYLSLSKNDNRFSPGIKSQKYIFSNKQPQKKLNSTQIINIRNPLRNSNTGKIIREPQINFYAQKSKKKPLSISKAVQLKKTPNHTLDTVKAIHIPKYRLDAPKIMSTPQQNLHAIKIKKGTEKVLKQQPIFMSPMNIEKTNWLLFSKNHSSSASNKNDSTNINKKLSGLTKNKVLKLPYSLKFTKMRENLKTEKIHKNPKYLESKKLLALSPQAVAMLAFADELDKKNENELNLKKVWEDKNKMQQAILKKYKDKLFQSKEGSLKKKENDSVRDVHKNIHIEYNNLIRNIQNKTNYLVTNHLPKYIEMEFEATTAAQRRIAYPTMRELKRMVINFHNKNSIKNMLEIERKIQDVTNSLAKYNQPTPSGSHKAKAKIKKKMPKELLNKQNNVSNKNKIETPFTPTRLISNWFLWNNYLSKLEKQNPSRTIKLKDS